MAGWEANETVIRKNETNEVLWDNVLNANELNAVNTLKKSLEWKVKSKDQISKANEMNSLIDQHFSFYNKKFDKNTNKFSEEKQEGNKTRIEIKDKVDLFYNNLLTDLRNKYDSMSYEKDWEKNVNNILELASFYIDLYWWDDKQNFVRADKTIQQTEEKFKWILRKFNPDVKSLSQTLTSKNPNVPTWFHLKEKKTEMIDWPLQKLDPVRYDLNPAEIWDKGVIENSFKEIKDKLNKENIKIKSFNIIWLSSKTDYVYSQQTVNLWNETLVVNDNKTLAEARAKVANNRFTENFWKKFDAWCKSNMSFKPEYGPEYIRWVDKADNPKYREFQWIRFEVDYTETKADNTYVFEKDQQTEWNQEYNKLPKTEVLIHSPGNAWKNYEYNQLEVTWRLNNWVSGATVGAENRWDKVNDMFVRSYNQETKKEEPSIVTKWYKQYEKFSSENPSKYPKITDPKKDLSRIDKLEWTNKSEYQNGEQVNMTPILNLDLSNKVHEWIVKDMMAKWVVAKWETNWQYNISANKTDKYISEYMSKRTKIYVKDAIENWQWKW